MPTKSLKIIGVVFTYWNRRSKHRHIEIKVHFSLRKSYNLFYFDEYNTLFGMAKHYQFFCLAYWNNVARKAAGTQWWGKGLLGKIRLSI